MHTTPKIMSYILARRLVLRLQRLDGCMQSAKFVLERLSLVFRPKRMQRLVNHTQIRIVERRLRVLQLEIVKRALVLSLRAVR